MANRSLVGLALLLLATLASGCGSDGDLRVVSVDDAAVILFDDPPPDLVVIDLRTPNEFSGARLPAAQLLDFRDPNFPTWIVDFDRDGSYLIYGGRGSRGDLALEMMADLGFVDVAAIEGGFSAWIEAGQLYVG